MQLIFLQDSRKANLQVVGAVGGTNGAKLYTEQSGDNKYVIKFYERPEDSHNEVLTNKLYQLAGVNVPQTSIVFDEENNQCGVASTYIETFKTAGEQALTAEQKRQLRIDGVVHAWLNNWDFIGQCNDNIGTCDNGKNGRILLSIDHRCGLNGRSLPSSGEGQTKTLHYGVEAFDAIVRSLRSLQDKNINPQTAALIGNLSDCEIKGGVERIARISEKEIRDCVMKHGFGAEEDKKELLNTILLRRKYLMMKYFIFNNEIDKDTEFEEIANLIVNAFYREVADGDVSYRQIYQEKGKEELLGNKYYEAIKRFKHGGMHASRVAFLVRVFYKLYKKFDKRTDSINEEMLKMLMIAAMFHDAGRARDSRQDCEEWERKSYELAKECLIALGYKERLATIVASSVFYAENNVAIFATKHISEIELTLEEKNDLNLLAQILHDADSMDYHRISYMPFDINRLNFYQLFAKKSKSAEELLARTIEEHKTVLKETGDLLGEPELAVYEKAKYEHNGQCYTNIADKMCEQDFFAKHYDQFVSYKIVSALSVADDAKNVVRATVGDFIAQNPNSDHEVFAFEDAKYEYEYLRNNLDNEKYDQVTNRLGIRYDNRSPQEIINAGGFNPRKTLCDEAPRDNNQNDKAALDVSEHRKNAHSNTGFVSFTVVNNLTFSDRHFSYLARIPYAIMSKFSGKTEQEYFCEHELSVPGGLEWDRVVAYRDGGKSIHIRKSEKPGEQNDLADILPMLLKKGEAIVLSGEIKQDHGKLLGRLERICKENAIEVQKITQLLIYYNNLENMLNNCDDDTFRMIVKILETFELKFNADFFAVLKNLGLDDCDNFQNEADSGELVEQRIKALAIVLNHLETSWESDFLKLLCRKGLMHKIIKRVEDLVKAIELLAIYKRFAFLKSLCEKELISDIIIGVDDLVKVLSLFGTNLQYDFLNFLCEKDLIGNFISSADDLVKVLKLMDGYNGLNFLKLLCEKGLMDAVISGVDDLVKILKLLSGFNGLNFLKLLCETGSIDRIINGVDDLIKVLELLENYYGFQFLEMLCEKNQIDKIINGVDDLLKALNLLGTSDEFKFLKLLCEKELIGKFIDGVDDLIKVLKFFGTFNGVEFLEMLCEKNQIDKIINGVDDLLKVLNLLGTSDGFKFLKLLCEKGLIGKFIDGVDDLIKVLKFFGTFDGPKFLQLLCEKEVIIDIIKSIDDLLKLKSELNNHNLNQFIGPIGNLWFRKRVNNAEDLVKFLRAFNYNNNYYLNDWVDKKKLSEELITSTADLVYVLSHCSDQYLVLNLLNDDWLQNHINTAEDLVKVLNVLSSCYLTEEVLKSLEKKLPDLTDSDKVLVAALEKLQEPCRYDVLDRLGTERLAKLINNNAVFTKVIRLIPATYIDRFIDLLGGKDRVNEFVSNDAEMENVLSNLTLLQQYVFRTKLNIGLEDRIKSLDELALFMNQLCSELLNYNADIANGDLENLKEIFDSDMVDIEGWITKLIKNADDKVAFLEKLDQFSFECFKYYLRERDLLLSFIENRKVLVNFTGKLDTLERMYFLSQAEDNVLDPILNKQNFSSPSENRARFFRSERLNQLDLSIHVAVPSQCC